MPGRHRTSARLRRRRSASTLRWLLIAAAVAVVALPAFVRAQGSISGVVLEDATRRPLRGVDVVARPVGDSIGSAPVSTDSLGRFRIPTLPSGRFRLEARGPGYEVLVTPPLGRDVAEAGRIELVVRPARSGVAALVRGTVVDSGNRPIGFAQVRVGPSGERVTDDSGRFDVAVRSAGRLPITVRRIGYRPFEVTLPGVPDSALRVVMQPLAGTLETVHIEADRTVASLERQGFYGRLTEHSRGANTGHFITPEEIEQRRPVRPSALLEGIPGVKILPISPKRYAAFGTNGCPMTVYLDGIRVSSLAEKTATDFDELIASPSLAGIEVYARANAPEQYRSLNGTCGVLLIWGK